MAHHPQDTVQKETGHGDAPDDFSCLNCGSSRRPKTRFLASGLIICREDNAWQCAHSIHYGYDYFCQCPLFVSIAQDIRKDDAAEAAGQPGKGLMKILQAEQASGSAPRNTRKHERM